MYEKSEVCSKAMFSTYKNRANQQWINSIKKANWEEGKEPIFNGATQTVSEVGLGGEFVKLYKIIFAEKEISGEEWLLEGLKDGILSPPLGSLTIANHDGAPFCRFEARCSRACERRLRPPRCVFHAENCPIMCLPTMSNLFLTMSRYP